MHKKIKNVQNGGMTLFVDVPESEELRATENEIHDTYHAVPGEGRAQGAERRRGFRT